MPVLCAIDHLVYAVGDVAAGAADVGGRLGVSPVPGGRHVGRGTRNELLGLGGGSYLEIIGPDAEQPTPPGGRSFGVDEGTQPRLVAWAARTTDLDAAVAAARAIGHDPGDPEAMERARPDGVLLVWRLTIPAERSVLPFLIDWGTTPHPSDTAPPGAELVALEVTDPEPARIRGVLDAWGLTQVRVERGSPGALRAELRGPAGPLVLA